MTKIALTPSQIRAMTRITNRAHTFAGRLCDAPMVWSIRSVSNRSVELVGSNTDVERRWFDNSRTLQAFIGKRGGVVYSSATDKLYTGL